MTNIVAVTSEEFSISLNQIAEHIYTNLHGQQTFDKHQEFAKKIMDHLVNDGLVEVDSKGHYKASLSMEGHTLPELIHRVASEINFR
jgi:hypothetical protein